MTGCDKARIRTHNFPPDIEETMMGNMTKYQRIYDEVNVNVNQRKSPENVSKPESRENISKFTRERIITREHIINHPRTYQNTNHARAYQYPNHTRSYQKFTKNSTKQLSD